MNQEAQKNYISGKYSIPILIKCFEVMEFLSDYPNGLTMQQIVNKLDIPKTTLHRLLSSMVELGYLCKNDTQHFFLSKKLLKLGLAALGEANLVEQSLPHMKKLRGMVKECVMLGVLMDDHVVLLEQIIGSHSFSFLLRPGTSFALNTSAPGKLFLAYSKETERERLLKTIEYIKHNNNTIIDESHLIEHIKGVREQGYSVDIEEEIAGIHCVAAPIFNQFGDITATIWTSGPSGRLKVSMLESTACELKKAAAAISSNLGYSVNY